MAYAVIAPLILVFALLYFAIGYVVLRNQVGFDWLPIQPMLQSETHLHMNAFDSADQFLTVIGVEVQNV